MINLTLKQLRYVEAAARLGSIANAATEMNISQSSITAAIDALETRLGYDVFIRTPARGIRTTASGRETLILIRRFIRQSKQFEDELSSLGGEAYGTVRIACYATAAPSFLPSVLRAITEDHPDASIQLLEGDMDRVVQYLQDGEADLGFTYRESVTGVLEFEPLFAAPPYVMVPKNDPLANQPSVTIDEMINRPIILLDLPVARGYFMDMFEKRGLAPNVAHSSRSSAIVRALVAGGFGISFLNIRPNDYRENESGYRILPLRKPPVTPVFGIATVAGTVQPRVVRSFIKSCLAMRDRGEFDDITVHAPDD